MPTSFTKESKPTTTFTKQAAGYTSSSFMLLESGDFILLETGDKIILSANAASLPVTTYTKETKP